MAALIPGLEIQVEGSYDSRNQLVAKLVKFEGSDQLVALGFMQRGMWF